MTTEQSYIKYICSNCANPDDEECEIRRRYDNTTYCRGYKKGKEFERFKQSEYRTAKYEPCIMPQLINN